MTPKTNIIIITAFGLVLIALLGGFYYYTIQQIDQAARQTIEFDAHKFLNLPIANSTESTQSTQSTK